MQRGDVPFALGEADPFESIDLHQARGFCRLTAPLRGHLHGIGNDLRASTVRSDGHAHAVSCIEMQQQRPNTADRLIVRVGRDDEDRLPARR